MRVGAMVRRRHDASQRFSASAWSWPAFCRRAGRGPGGLRRLLRAVQRNDRAAIRQLLDRKAGINAAQPDGTTALHWAAYHDDVDLVSRLLAAGADVRATNRYGVTPLSIASQNGNAAHHREIPRRRRRCECVAAGRRDDADDGRSHGQGGRRARAAGPRRRRAREGTAAGADGDHVGGGRRPRRGPGRAHQGGRRFPDSARLRVFAVDVCRSPGTHRRREGAAEGRRRRERAGSGARQSETAGRRAANPGRHHAAATWPSRTGISSWRRSCSTRARTRTPIGWDIRRCT